MYPSRFSMLLMAAALVMMLCLPVQALDVDSDSIHCFCGAEFSAEDEVLEGICITGIPDSSAGTVLLGSRVLRAGDILTGEQLEQMSFVPVRTETDREAVMTYLPIYNGHVDPQTTMTLSIHGKVDQPPVAQDSAMETYKNLPNEGKLDVSDPEGMTLVFTVNRQPKRGTVEVREDGSFVYTPKKNKVGTDSFTYTAADPAGNVSREATVTVQIMKPTDSKQYSDTTGETCRFEAEWMRSTGIFSGDTLGDQLCFRPEQTVSRGDFLAMVMNTLNIPVDETVTHTGFSDDAPAWLRPYLAAAMRAGIVCGYECENGVEFRPTQAVTGAEAAVMLQNAMALTGEIETAAIDAPVWAQTAVAVMQANGVTMPDARAAMTRSDAARMLYRASKLAQTAPGLTQVRLS